MRFLNDFTIAYDAVVFRQDAVAASAAQVAESAAKEEKPEPETPKVKKGGWQTRLAEFRSEAEM